MGTPPREGMRRMTIDVSEPQFFAIKTAVLERQKKGQRLSTVEFIREAIEEKLSKKEGARK